MSLFRNDRARPAVGRPILRPALLALGLAMSGRPAATAAPKVDFARDIQPIISARCFQCHGPDDSSRKGKLRLDLRDDALRPRKDGSTPIQPGNLAASTLITRITSTDPDEVMPPPKEGPPLKPEQIDRLKRWVAEGAPYVGHWAFNKPARPPLPRVRLTSWPRNGLDYFILAKLERQRLQPAPPADRHTLIR